MQFIDIAKDAAEGVYVVGGMDRFRSHPDLDRFKAEFKKRAGYEMETVAANCYGAVRLVGDAITRAGKVDSTAIRDALAATKNFPLLTGNLAYFNAIGELYEPLEIAIVKNGNFVGATVIDDPA